MVDAHFLLYLMICLMELLQHDVHRALKMLILLMAEQQQRQAVDVTLDCLENVYDTPFFVNNFTNG